MTMASTEVQQNLMSREPVVEPWRFWATAAWGLAAFAAWLATQMIAVAALLAWWDLGTAGLATIAETLDRGVVIAVVVLASTPAFLCVVAVAVRLARASAIDYLALVPPRRRDFLLALACLVVLLPLGDLVTWLSGRDILHPFMVHNYITAREAGPWAVFALACAIVVAAPLTEEIAFRGFLYRGWAASPLGPAGTIALTSAIWTVMHIQYETFFLVQIFGLGLVFGWLRWRSGSTLLTIWLHVLVNFTALLQTALVLAWRS
jgi:membrane protease YdiL (CAAX protease family)